MFIMSILALLVVLPLVRLIYQYLSRILSIDILQVIAAGPSLPNTTFEGYKTGIMGYSGTLGGREVDLTGTVQVLHLHSCQSLF